jgi:hypothetical protein
MLLNGIKVNADQETVLRPIQSDQFTDVFQIGDFARRGHPSIAEGWFPNPMGQTTAAPFTGRTVLKRRLQLASSRPALRRKSSPIDRPSWTNRNGLQ